MYLSIHITTRASVHPSYLQPHLQWHNMTAPDSGTSSTSIAALHELKTQSQQATHAMDPRPEGMLPDVLSFPRTLSINFKRKRQGRTRVTRRAPQNLEVRLTTSLQIYYMQRFSVLGCFMTRRMHGILSYISVNP